MSSVVKTSTFLPKLRSAARNLSAVPKMDVEAPMTFKLAKAPQEKEDVLNFFFNHFMANEQFLRYLPRGFEDSRPDEAVNHIQSMLDLGLCLVMENEDKMIGASYNVAMRREDVEAPKSLDELLETNSPLLAKLWHLFDNLCFHPSKIFNLFPESRQCLNLVFSAIHPDFSNRGLATRSAEASLEAGREAGCDTAMAIVVQDVTARLMRRLRFEKVASVKLADVDLNGERFFKNVPYGYAEAYVKQL